MATIRIFLGIICLIAFGRSGLFGSGALGFIGPGAEHPESVVAGKQPPVLNLKVGLKRLGYPKASTSPLIIIKKSLPLAVKPAVIWIAQSQIGVREATGKNDGLKVEQYLAYTGEQKGAPWCAAFVSWVFGQAGYPQPRTAWSPALFPAAKRTSEIKPATVFGIYFPALKRIAHCGFVERLDGHWIITIEGNTNITGGREGDGVYRKRRLASTIRYFAGWNRGKEETRHEKF